MAKEQMSPTLSVEEARQAFAAAFSPGMERVRSLLRSLTTPPQVLLLEGGDEAQRQAVARWWAALQHCESPDAQGPCLHCPACTHIGAGLHLDVLAFDGRISNKDDEDNPGPVRAFNMDNARTLKARLGDAPRSGKRRVVTLCGLDMTRDAAANALLKVLEEPSPTTVFVLMAPQREQLLPTLVSRSWVLTLPWPEAHRADPDMAVWETALAEFLAQGRGWWSLTSAKGAVDQAMAQRVVLACQKSLMASMAEGHLAQRPLAARFAALTADRRLHIAALLDEAQEALLCNVSPGRVLDWVATRLFMDIR